LTQWSKKSKSKEKGRKKKKSLWLFTDRPEKVSESLQVLFQNTRTRHNSLLNHSYLSFTEKTAKSNPLVLLLSTSNGALDHLKSLSLRPDFLLYFLRLEGLPCFTLLRNCHYAKTIKSHIWSMKLISEYHISKDTNL